MTEPKDRRTAERYPVNADVACPFLAPVVEGFGTAKVKDVSMNGIGLLLSRRVEPGALLAVVLSNPVKGFSKTVLVRVAHATPHMGSYLVGGTFETPLTYQEMSTLVL
jgi:hypothetical protein